MKIHKTPSAYPEKNSHSGKNIPKNISFFLLIHLVLIVN